MKKLIFLVLSGGMFCSGLASSATQYNPARYAESTKLYEEGKKASAEGDYKRAIALFNASKEILQTPGNKKRKRISLKSAVISKSVAISKKNLENRPVVMAAALTTPGVKMVMSKDPPSQKPPKVTPLPSPGDYPLLPHQQARSGGGGPDLTMQSGGPNDRTMGGSGSVQ